MSDRRLRSLTLPARRRQSQLGREFVVLAQAREFGREAAHWRRQGVETCCGDNARGRAVALAVAVGGYALGKSSGEDLAAAKAAGINFIHLPLSGTMPDPAVVDNFLKAIAAPGNQPALIHCASGNRASAMWFIKRVMVDKWDTDRAMAEASELGAISQAMKTFALDYIKAHQK